MISRKPRNEAPLDNPMAQVFDDVDGEDKPRPEDKIAELEAALRELQEKNENDRQDALLRASGPSFQSQVTEQFVEVNPDTIQLPDPALDPVGYDAAVGKRTEIRIENKQRKDEFDRKRNNDIETKVQTLWSNFADDYPDHAINRKRTEFAAQEVIKRAVAKGVDAQRYMFVTQDRFLKDVAKEYEEIFGAPETDDEDYEDTRSRKARPRARANSSRRDRETDDNVARTSGIFGGNDGSGRTSRKTQTEDEPGDMIDDIHKMQKTSGFF